MSIAHELSVIALRCVTHVVSHGAGSAVGNATAKLFIDRFTDHSHQMMQALQRANELAWRTLESALAGPSIFDYLKKTDDRIIIEQVRIVFESSQLKSVAEQDPKFCKRCLVELRAAREQGKLRSGRPLPRDLAREAHALALLNDPQALLNAEWERVQRIAQRLQQTEFVNLGHLLNHRPGNNSSPMLAGAVRYFFRREVERNQQLFQGLAFSQLEDISERQQKVLGAVTTLLTEHGQRYTTVMDQVLHELGVIQGTLTLIQDQQVKWKMEQEEWQKKQDEWQKKAMGLLEKLDMDHREVRPVDSFSIRNDGERQFVRNLIEQYRQWPEEQRERLPGLLNQVGKLELATGEFDAAQRDFGDVAVLADAPPVKAEAHYNEFQAALEQKKWPEALTALKEAVALDSARFAPFPFAQYEAERILGAGGFGIAFLCKHAHLGKRLVIKSIRTTAMDRSISDVFSEARALDQMHHPSIIRLIDCAYADSAKTRPYLVMDFFDGTSLESLIESQGILEPAQLLGIAGDVAEALQAAHASGILHRDVKPGNVLVRPDGDCWAVKLIDFGLAIQPGLLEGRVSTHASQSRTIMGSSIAGTMRYAAPEQLGYAPDVGLGTHSDVYGFGKTCYYALFQTPEPDEVDRENLPEAWRKFLRDCTASRLSNRLANFTDVLARLHDLRSAVQPPVVPDPPVLPVMPNAPVHDMRPLYLNAKGIIATGHQSPDGFIVSANSKAVAATFPSIQDNVMKVRQDLIERQILVQEGDCFVLKQDQSFTSPSAASGVLLGQRSNGLEMWKDQDGRTLKDIQEKAKTPEDRLKELEAKLRRLESKIRKVERFEVVITCNGGTEGLPSYDYEKAAKNDLTVAQWRSLRFAKDYPDCQITVLCGDESEAHGVTKLATVRESYS